ncbi:GAF domain-containing sensor histidine kinase [Deinococcus yavapaiensis]|nr:ATP-binding protein [Deinococcus yavapaiensis]
MDSVLRGSRLAPSFDDTMTGKIVEDARLALGMPYIALARFDEATRTTRIVATGGASGDAMQRGIRLARRLIPSFDPFSATASADYNEHTRAVYFERRVVMAPLSDIVGDLVPPLMLQIAAKVAGISHCMLVPLHVEERVFGSLVCVQRGETFTEADTRIACAFASQVALHLRNLELLAEQRRITLALEESRALVTEAEERTKREISEFLHSRVQSRLLVAWYRLGELSEQYPEARPALERVREDLEHLREHDVRSISHLLHPEALGVGLVAALQVLASRLVGVLDIRILADRALLAIDSPIHNRLPMNVRLAAFRTIEEAVGNVLKHAHARNVTISLSTPAGSDVLHLEVVDDGQGFDPASARSGLGLRCLEARLDHFGGRWGIESAPGGPTRLWASLPRCSSDLERQHATAALT